MASRAMVESVAVTGSGGVRIRLVPSPPSWGGEIGLRGARVDRFEVGWIGILACHGGAHGAVHSLAQLASGPQAGLIDAGRLRQQPCRHHPAPEIGRRAESFEVTPPPLSDAGAECQAKTSGDESKRELPLRQLIGWC